jgi:hypothetical protein
MHLDAVGGGPDWPGYEAGYEYMARLIRTILPRSPGVLAG